MIGVKAVNGIAWAYGAFFSEKVLALLTTVFLARVLTPDDFGLIAAALLITGFIDAIRDFGIRDALIYTSEDVDLAADTAFWLIVVIGVCQTIMTLALAPLSVYVIDDPRIEPLLLVLSLTFVLNSLGLTHEALLRKRLEFKTCYVVDLCATALKTVTAVGLIIAGAEIWSIIAAHLVGAAARTIGRWLVLDWVPKARWTVMQARKLLQYGIPVFVIVLIDQIAASSDQFLIATLLDQRQLAFFFIASRLPDMLLFQLNSVVTNVIFSVFSSIKEQRELVLTAFFRTLKYSALATVPIAAGIIALANEIILVVFGNQWLPSVPLTQLLTASALMMCLSWSAGDLLKAQGRPDVVMKLGALELVYTAPVVALLLFVFRDPVAAALGILVCNTVAGAIRLFVLARVLNYPMSQYLGAFRSAFVGGAMILTSVAIGRDLLADYGSVVVMLVGTMIGALTYFATIWWLERKEVIMAAQLVLAAVKSANSRATIVSESPS